MTDLPIELVHFEHALIRAAHRDLHRSRRRKLAAIGTVGLACLCGTALASTNLLGVSALNDPSTPPAPPSIVADFRTLGMPAPGDTLPDSVPVDARSLGQGIYISQRDGTLCLWIEHNGAQCGRRFIHSITLLATEGRASESSPFMIDVAGVGQDGVREVRIQTTTGTTTVLPVTNNGFRGTFQGMFSDIGSVEIVHTDGTIEHGTPSDYGFAGGQPSG